jgi:hypothetical protein
MSDGKYLDDSTGLGDRGEPNARGLWNKGGDWELVEAPAFRDIKSDEKGTRLTGNGAVVRQSSESPAEAASPLEKATVRFHI